MLDRKSGQVGIHDEGTRDLRLPEERGQNLSMASARM